MKTLANTEHNQQREERKTTRRKGRGSHGRRTEKENWQKRTCSVGQTHEWEEERERENAPSNPNLEKEFLLLPNETWKQSRKPFR